MFRSWRGAFLAAAFLISAAGPLLSQPAQAQSYTVVDLATLSPGLATIVRGPNSGGRGVGGGHLPNRGLSGERRGLLFERGVPPQALAGLPGTDDTTIFGVNDTGAYVGSSNAATAVRGFAGQRGGGTRELPPLQGDTGSVAFAVNNIGQAAGYSSGPGGQRAVVWSAQGVPTALPGFANSRALAVNERGDVAGVSGSGPGRRPVVWPAGQVARELPLLAGHAAGEAYAINSRGDIVGYSATTAGTRRATLWDGGTGVVELATLPGGNFSQAFGINDS
ncbi:MAG: hypothetical protein KY444_08935, partial [Gemmatimonadetes bacterium]|nr:hypothetical protein [Gemmatimonadota bacterium]